MPATSAPKIATPTAPPTWRAVFSTAEAVPAWRRSTPDRMDVVIAGTARPMPAGISASPGSICRKVASLEMPHQPSSA
ncbi:hypothetical protein RugamoR64_25590 [Duganella rhizosphaerae]